MRKKRYLSVRTSSSSSVSDGNFDFEADLASLGERGRKTDGRRTMSALKDMDLLDGAEEELAAAGSPQERNWRGVAIALFVITIMCSIIAIAVLILTPLNANADAPTTRVSLQDVVGLGFLSPIESIEWVDSQRVVVKQSDSFEMLDLTQRPLANTTKLLDTEALYRYGKASSVAMSPDESYIIVSYSATKRSPKSVYRIFDRRTSTFENVGPTKSGDETVKVLAWNPVGDDFAYVHNNNVYYQLSPSAKESTQITFDGRFDVINGATDWLYEEEILQTPRALWWSKSGEYMAFLSIDNRLVNHVDIPIYAQHQYPFIVQQSYPKTGAANLPLVSVNVWRKSDGLLKRLNVTGVDPGLLTYLYSASWIQLYDNDVLAVVWANRYQNATLVSLCSFSREECVPNFFQKYSFDNFRLWAEPDDAKIRFHTFDAYFVLLPHRRSNGNVYTQIARINVKPDLSNGRETFVPLGEYDVERIEAFDAVENKIYFTAAAPKPSQRHLFVTQNIPEASQGEGSADDAVHCVTCNVSTNCTFHETSFAPTRLSPAASPISLARASGDRPEFLYLNCKGPGTPHVLFGRVVNTTQFVSIAEYGRNKALERALSTHFLPNVIFDNVTLADGQVAYVKMLLPHELPLKPPYPPKRFPVLVNVYAGPGTQKATEEWLSTTADIYFASGEDYVVVFIDGRGSGHRGWRQKQPIYGHLGSVEVDDQIYAIRQLLKLYTFMDKYRVGIWGWSYGGFVSARAVQRDNNSTFKCAASVAPVTNFKYYDATYTERYMGHPDSDAYALTDLTRNVSAFHKTPYMLVHGTGDDNVHFQNTAEFVRALTEDNVQFELMVYTDDSHNLASGRWHMYNMLRNFFRQCFAP